MKSLTFFNHIRFETPHAVDATVCYCGTANEARAYTECFRVDDVERKVFYAVSICSTNDHFIKSKGRIKAEGRTNSKEYGVTVDLPNDVDITLRKDITEFLTEMGVRPRSIEAATIEV
ncbi:hypothetical protein HN682_04715 [Candidatus Peregrinibacteria bacterium]|jgi:hypothetical protein|nr:hypothetical protein [Candidatus Peregrinibacteria bacterium]